jgi:hypothetical protein
MTLLLSPIITGSLLGPFLLVLALLLLPLIAGIWLLRRGIRFLREEDRPTGIVILLLSLICLWFPFWFFTKLTI